MLNKFYDFLGGATSVSVIIISVALMLLVGFLFTRITKLLKLPNVTAYILAGIVIGPFCLDLVPAPVIKGTDFISDIALAFIAFSVGEFFKFSTLKKNGAKVVVITLFEALVASVVIFILTFFILRLGFAFSLVLAALASATAPASTMMTIRQTKAKGDFVDTLLSVVALDDVVSLIAFSVAISVALATMGGQLSAGDILLPIAYNIVLVGVGILFGFLLKFLMKKRSTDNRLIVAVAFIFAICGIGAALSVSPLLGCMAMGTMYINVSNDEKLFKQLNYFSPPILLLFFVRSGLSFRLDVLFDFSTGIGGVPLLAIGALYFIVRIAGKYGGAFLGCLTAKKPKKVRNFLGLALIPQAGVSIGLAALGARYLGGVEGDMLQTVILASSILYELIGPACAKLSLYLSGSYGPKAEPVPEGEAAAEAIVEPSEVETLEARLLQIQNEIEKKKYARSEEEEAFMEAADDAYKDETDEDTISDYMKRKFKNRR
ncbi:MAG: cation:proton antiporter [Clostridiales bacterium]|nr:cation:proton antiporter [Clostridiales bacterium]